MVFALEELQINREAGSILQCSEFHKIFMYRVYKKKALYCHVSIFNFFRGRNILSLEKCFAPSSKIRLPKSLMIKNKIYIKIRKKNLTSPNTASCQYHKATL